MFQRDYILRMIEQFVKVLAKILFNKEAKNYSTALDEIRQSYHSVFGIDKELISISSAEEIVTLLKLQGRAEPKVFIMLAEFLKEEADLHKELKDISPGEVDKIYCKALSLFYEAVLPNSDFHTTENFEKIDYIINAFESHSNQPGLVINTFRYFELTGEFAKAENLLFDLINLSPEFAVYEGENFFDRLKDKSDDELRNGNFSREEIEQGLSEFRERINKLPSDG